MFSGWLPDWRDASAYRFERLDRTGFAWEWLRRDPEYRDAANEVCADAARNGDAALLDAAADWGLVRFERPELAAPAARPLWRADVDRSVLVADALPAEPGDASVLRLEGLDNLTNVAMARGVAHVLLTDGWRRVRIDLHGWLDRRLTIAPCWRLSGVRVHRQLLALNQLISILRSRHFSNRLWPREPRARRWALALRAHDALAAGGGQRAIAQILGADTGATQWRSREPSARLQAQRLAALSRALTGTRFANRYLG